MIPLRRKFLIFFVLWYSDNRWVSFGGRSHVWFMRNHCLTSLHYCCPVNVNYSLDYKEEQTQELEVLKSIYPDELEGMCLAGEWLMKTSVCILESERICLSIKFNSIWFVRDYRRRISNNTWTRRTRNRCAMCVIDNVSCFVCQDFYALTQCSHCFASLQ